MHRETKILIADDQPIYIQKIKSHLINSLPDKYQPIRPIICISGEEAYENALKFSPDIILLDYVMETKTSGVDTIKKLKNNELTKEIPIIMITSLDSDEVISEVFREGAVDYIQKDKLSRPTELIARVTSALNLHYADQKRKELIFRIFPGKIAEALLKSNQVKEELYEKASVLFTDFEGFTSISQNFEPYELIFELDYCFNKFDEIAEKYGLERIKTIGDSYMAVGGVPEPDETHPVQTILMGLEIQDFMTKHRNQKLEAGLPYWRCRLGIHTGELIAGVIGIQKRPAFDIWGNTVNLASRMESNGEPGKVNVSQATYELSKDYFDFEYRGELEVKNLGPTPMYFVKGLKSEYAEDNHPYIPNEKFWNKLESQLNKNISPVEENTFVGNTQELKDQVKKFITAAELQKALDIFLKFCVDQKLLDQEKKIRLLCSRYNTLKFENELAMITDENFRVETTRINQAILNFLDQL